jgi:peptidoglycan/LPS O-acetylase OafA/YrhL
VPWRQVGLYYALFAANVAETFYPAKGNPLGVLWSLAIEEHFYLIWPFAIRYLNRRQLLWLLTVVIVAEPILRAGITPFLTNYLPVYYLTPFRLDGLAAGSLLAVLVEDPNSTNFLVNWSGKVAAVLFALLAFLFTRPSFQRETNSWWFNGFGYTLIIAFCFFFLAAIYFNSDSRLSRVLAWRPLVFLGTISYGFYLFHPIIMRAMDRFGAEIGFPYRHRLSPATFLLSVTVSWLSFRFYEKPVTRWGHRKAKQM